MSHGRSREEQELTSRLAAGLVAREVIAPMEKIGWGHGTPPPPEQNSPSAPGRPGAEGAPGAAAAPAAAQPVQGQPLPAPVAKPAPAGEPNADSAPDTAVLDKVFEPLRDPATGLILGKFKTGLEAFKSAPHLVQMTKTAFETRDSALKQLSELQAENMRLRTSPAATPAAAPQATKPATPSREAVDKAQANLDKVLSEITENGGVLDAETSQKMSKAQRELADAIAEARVNEIRVEQDAVKERQDADQAEWKKVNEAMAAKYPDSVRFSEEAGLNVQVDPLLRAQVNALLAQGNKLGAAETAWLAYERVRPKTTEERVNAEHKEIDLAAREQVRKEAVEKARIDAGIVGGTSAGGSGVHPNERAGGSREEIAAAADAMRREGGAPGSPAAMRWRQLVIGPSLDPTIFGPR